MHQTVVFVNSG